MKRETGKTAVGAALFIAAFLCASMVWAWGFGEAGLALRETGGSDPDGFPAAVKMVPVGDDLAVLWLDNRDDPDRFGGVATLQMVTEEGNRLLPENGVLLDGLGWCPDISAYDAVPDGSGGLFVCASDEDRPNTPKVVQRYGSSGEPSWDEPLLFSDLLLTQAMISLGGGRVLCLFARADPELKLIRVDGSGDWSEWTVGSEPSARGALPVGIAPRNGGYYAVGQVIYSANSSDLRRIMLNADGEPDWNPDGSMFYYGRVNSCGLVRLGGNHALALVSGDDFNLIGQYFSAGGSPLWEFSGLELLPGEVIESSACDAPDGFWLEARRTVEDHESVSLQRLSSLPEPLTEEIFLAEETVHTPLADPVADGAGGVFAVRRAAGELQPAAIQFDDMGVVRDGYDPPRVMDTLQVEAEVAAAVHMWGDLIVAYGEDRYGSGRSGLYLQRFVNAVPNSVSPAGGGLTPGAPDPVSLYPNPFNGVLTVELRLPRGMRGRVAVYDLLGRLVGEEALPVPSAGITRLPLPFGGVPSGMYYLRVRTSSGVWTRAVTLIR